MTRPPRTLQPLTIIASIWIDISMDFIVGLPKARNKVVIVVVVDQLSKYAHLCALQHQFTPAMVTQLFLDQIFKLHGMPKSIVSNGNATFTRKFW